MRIKWNLDEFERVRKSPGMKAHLNDIGSVTVARCNADLHAAQSARKQPVADGYDHKVTEGSTRARLIISATTARALAHEAVNNAILKNLPIGSLPEIPAADHEIPRELARRSDAARNLDRQGNRIHRLDS